MKNYLEIAMQGAVDAGNEILEIYESDFAVEHKDDKSPLTLADKRGHLEIMSYLENTLYPVLSEEGKHLSYDEALTNVMNYYEDWGYDRTIKYLRELSSSGKIPLRFRVRLQDKVVDRCMKPTPRALVRKFNRSSV